MWGGCGAISLDLGPCISNDDGNLRSKDDKVEYLADDIWNGANCYLVNEASGTCLNLDGGQSCLALLAQSFTDSSPRQPK